MADEPGAVEGLGSSVGSKLRDLWDSITTSKPNPEGATAGSAVSAFGRAAAGGAATTMAGNVLTWLIPGVQSRGLFEGALGKGAVSGLLGSAFNWFSNGQNDGTGVGIMGALGMQVLNGDSGIVKKLLFAAAAIFLGPMLFKGLGSMFDGLRGEKPATPEQPKQEKSTTTTPTPEADKPPLVAQGNKPEVKAPSLNNGTPDAPSSAAPTRPAPKPQRPFPDIFEPT
jgi:hypothetical protein